ncbi:MAG: DUF1552 domain-containing protein [Planctomycetia bacterium]
MTATVPGPSRRHFLRGVGVSMALPWLESVNAAGGTASGGSDPHAAPARLAVLFSGNGFHGTEFWAKGEGAGLELGRVLEPLHGLREKLTFIGGLWHAEARGNGIHSAQTGNMLSGAPLAPGGEIRSGTSFDQVLAASVGRATKVPSLVLGCETSNPSVHKNYSMIYSSHISWSSSTAPTPLELFPALAFYRLFKDDAAAGTKSVLDAILADARDFRRDVSVADRRTLDEFLESVQSVEKRIAGAGERGDVRGWRPTLEKPDRDRPGPGIPQDIAEHMRLMCDIVVLGFQTDTTRISTLKLNNDHSAQRFPNLPKHGGKPGEGIDYMIHHLLSHTDTEDWLRVNQFFMEQTAYLAGRLDAIREGERTLLDNTLLLHTSSMINGQHDNTRLPAILLGGAGRGVRGGRVLDYARKPDRQMCRLFMSLMDKMGDRPATFGDARSMLEEV